MGFEIDSFAVAAQDRSLRGVGIVRADGALGASILAVGVRDGIWGVGIRTQAAEILAVGSDDFRGRGHVGI
jgi:hypothetical protein